MEIILEMKHSARIKSVTGGSETVQVRLDFLPAILPASPPTVQADILGFSQILLAVRQQCLCPC